MSDETAQQIEDVKASWTLMYRRPDGTFVIELANTWPYHVTKDDPLFDAVAEAAKGVDLPPEPEAPPLDVRREVPKLLAMERLEVAGFGDAFEAEMAKPENGPSRRMFNAATTLYADDDRVRDFLIKIGADPDRILAP